MKYLKANIYHLIALFTIFIIQFSILNSQDTWIRTYQPFGNDVSYEVEDIRICPDSGYAVIGTILIDDWDRDGFMMKTDSDGNLLWANIDSVDFIPDPQPSGFVVLEDGSFITAGNYYWSNVGNYLLKRNSQGGIEWTQQLDNEFTLQALELTNDENLITTGFSTYNTIFLEKLDLSGNLIWRETYLPDGYEYGGGYSVTQTSDNGYAITGIVNGPDNWDILVLKTDANGDSLWTWTYDGYGIYDLGYSIINNHSGNLVIAGILGDYAPIYDWGFAVEIDINGDTLWTRQFDRNNEITEIRTILQTSEGYYVLKSSKMIKIDENQEILWDSSIDYDLNFGYALGDRCIQLLENEQFICAGRKTISGQHHIVLSKTDSIGNVTSVNEDNITFSESKLICFPNPFQTEINFCFNTLNNNNLQLNIFNIKGQIVNRLPIQNKIVSWNSFLHGSGIYLCELIDKDNNTVISTKKILKVK